MMATSPMIAAVSMVKDEPIIDHTIRHLLAEGISLVLVADNSTDDTADLLARLATEQPGVVEVRPVHQGPPPDYPQSAVMTALAAEAGARGAEWIIPFDADEIWHSIDRTRTLADTFATQDPGTGVLVAGVWEHVPQPDDPIHTPPDPFRSMVHRRPELWAWEKVAFRAQPGVTVWRGSHGVTPEPGRRIDGQVAIRHFPYRTPEQAATKLNRTDQLHAGLADPAIGIHVREAVEQVRARGFAAWWDTTMARDGLVYDPAPVQP